MFQVGCNGSYLLPGPLFQGARPWMVDKPAPDSTLLPTNGQACGWLLLKGQALVSPNSATTETDPRDQMGPWQLSLQEDWVHRGLYGLA